MNLKLGDWVIPEVPGSSYPAGTTFSREIAGRTYGTVIMPDGKEWMAEYLQDDTAGGLWYTNDPSLAYLGRHYNYAELSAFSYPGGWHVPTKAEWDAMVAACGDSSGLAYRLCNSEGWAAGTTLATNAVDTYGLHITPTGKLYARGWFDSNYYAYIWYGLYDDPTYTYITKIYSGDNTVPVDNYVKPIGSANYAAVRLVRDADPMPPIPAIYGYRDLVFDDSGRAILVEDLAQRVDCRLRTFMGEHWLNPEIGVPWFEEFLGQKNPNLSVCRSLLLTVIQGVPGVTAVTSLDLGFAKNSNSRVLEVRFTVTGTDSLPVSGTTAVTA